MTIGEKNIKDFLKDAGLLSAVTFMISYPYLYHYIVHKPDYLSPFNAKMSSLTNKEAGLFAFAQITIFLSLIFLCSLVGFGFSKRYKLKGFGTYEALKKDIKYFLLIAIPLNIILFYIFDRLLKEKVPTLYPNSPVWGLAKAFMTSSTFEIVSKFGLVTVVMGVFKNKHLAVLIPAIFFSFLVRKTFLDYGVEFGFNYLAITAVVSTFIYGIVSGYIFIYRGLLSVMILRFLLDLKYLFYPLFS